MTIDGLIAVIALLIAAYQIMPRHRQLELKLRFQRIDSISVLLALFIILYLQFYAVFAPLGLTLSWGLHRWAMTPQLASFLVVIALTGFLFLRFRYAQLSPHRVGRFSELFDELLWAGRDEEVVVLLKANAHRLIQIAQNKTAISRLHSFLDPQPERVSIFQVQTAPTKEGKGIRSYFTFLLRHAGPWLSSIIPNYARQADDARRLLLKVTAAGNVAGAIVKTDPYLGLLILGESDLIDREKFLTNYFAAQLKYPLSALHYEIRNCQKLGWNRPYDIAESHKLLRYLFLDARVAERLEVYRPVGESVIAELEELARNKEMDPNNFSRSRAFSEGGYCESPIFAAIAFFDVMVTSAFHQGIAWHMWLYYLTYFAKGIVNNCSPNDPAITPGNGSETRYGFYLYKIFERLRDCGRLAELRNDLPADHVNRMNENDNIPKSAMSALAQSLRYLLGSPAFEPRFKAEITSMVFGLYFDLRYSGRHRYAECLIHLLRPETFGYIAPNPDAYIDGLQLGFESFDKVPHRLRQPEYVEALHNQLFR